MTDPSMKMMQILWPAGLAVQAVRAAAELRLAELIVDGPKSLAQLAASTGAPASSLGKLLRALTSLAVFEETPSGTFAQTPMSDTLRAAHPQSMRAWAQMLGGDFITRSTGALTTTILTGTPGFEHVFGTAFFNHLATNTQDATTYDSAMGSLPGNVEMIVSAYDFSSCTCVVDVGGGRGALLAAILASYPRLTGVLYDRPEVVENAPRSDRLSVVSGNFFDEVPSVGDTYILSRVVHDWDDASALTILRNCRRALNGRGRLLIVDAIATREDDASRAFMDLLMLSLTGGRERSEDEFRQLLAAAGFTLMRVIPTATAAVIECVPAEPPSPASGH